MIEIVRQPGMGQPAGVWAAEPAFWMDTRRGLVLPEWGRTPVVAEFLAHRVARCPNDLQAHVRRVLLQRQLGDADGVYGALLDLCIALRGVGREVRERMLGCAGPLLSPSRRQALEARLDAGLGPTDPMPASRHSVLGRGLSASVPVVLMTEGAQKHEATALEQARELIESGRVAEAQELLESALVRNPDDDEVGLELLEVYQHTRDTESLRRMCRLLGKLGTPSAQAWVGMAELFAIE